MATAEHQSPEVAALLSRQQQANGNAKQLRLLRREIRYRLFRIREAKCGNPRSDYRSYDKGLGSWFELQFKQNGSTWYKFTHEWDTAVDEPMKLVRTPSEFLLSGGLCQANNGFICTPPTAKRTLYVGNLNGLNPEVLYFFTPDQSQQLTAIAVVAHLDLVGFKAVRTSGDELIDGQVRMFDPSAFTADCQGI